MKHLRLLYTILHEDKVNINDEYGMVWYILNILINIEWILWMF